jgi:hypothetical protein
MRDGRQSVREVRDGRIRPDVPSGGHDVSGVALSQAGRRRNVAATATSGYEGRANEGGTGRGEK